MPSIAEGTNLVSPAKPKRVKISAAKLYLISKFQLRTRYQANNIYPFKKQKTYVLVGAHNVSSSTFT